MATAVRQSGADSRFQRVVPDPVQVPLWLDLPAVVVSALGGALVGARRHFDLFGIIGLGLVTGLSGGLIRDILLNQLPVALKSPWYIVAALAASVVIVVSARLVDRAIVLLIVLEAAALGLYGVTGINKTLALGLGMWPAVLVGLVAALGGGALRDISTANPPEIFQKGGQLFATAALAGLVAYLVAWNLGASEVETAIIGTAVTFVVRILAWRFNWVLPGPLQVPGGSETQTGNR